MCVFPYLFPCDPRVLWYPETASKKDIVKMQTPKLEAQPNFSSLQIVQPITHVISHESGPHVSPIT